MGAELRELGATPKSGRSAARPITVAQGVARGGRVQPKRPALESVQMESVAGGVRALRGIRALPKQCTRTHAGYGGGATRRDQE